jgi:hypothetical protein
MKVIQRKFPKSSLSCTIFLKNAHFHYCSLTESAATMTKEGMPLMAHPHLCICVITLYLVIVPKQCSKQRSGPCCWWNWLDSEVQ